MMSRKGKYIIATLLILAIGIGLMSWQRQRTREAARSNPAQRDRYFDSAAIQEYSIKMERPNATVSGVVVNNTWKTRDIGVWAGFVKSDGFHEGGTTGRNYYGYQYFPQVPPKDKRNFSIDFAVPPLNRSWSVVAEFDPKENRLRPVW